MASNLVNSQNNIAIIVAAGSGSRMGDNTFVPKQYAMLGGKPVVQHSIDVLQAFCHRVVLVVNKEHAHLYNKLENIEVVQGGSTRQQSVFNALKHIYNFAGNVLIHDAARPFVTQDTIKNLLDKLKTANNAVPYITLPETAIYKGKKLDREKLMLMQTPQCFNFSSILQAHSKAEQNQQQFTDDATLFSEVSGQQINWQLGLRCNFKITTQEDMEIAKTVTASQNPPIVKIGNGYDVHKFATDKGEHKIMLGGVEVEHSYKLVGHSDADVVLHSVTDAILGAIGADDIGQHFPPSDEQWRGVDSSIFLEKAVSLLRQQNGQINNLDVTIICQSPNISAVRELIKNNIASLLGVANKQVNIKATTTEGLGFEGRKEGIAVQAIVSITCPNSCS